MTVSTTTTTPPRIARPAPAEDPHAAQERREAARALLMRPLLTDPEALRLVRRHRLELTRLFADGLGYRLVVEPTVARLFKGGLGRDGSRALLRRNGRSFTPRGYALLCLTVAALSRGRSQLLVDELVAEVRSTAAEAGIDVDLDAATDRRALHGALTALVDLEVLTERDGDLEHWVDRRTLSLLDIDRTRLGLLVGPTLGGVEDPGALLDVAALPSAAGGARVAVRRRLVECPVLSVSDLDDDQAEWWRRNRNREQEWFRSRFALDLELRSEGALAIDPADELTDDPFPGPGSARHFALLWLDGVVAAVRERARDSATATLPWHEVDAVTLSRVADAVHATWRAGLRRDHRDDPTRARSDAQQE
ncbi:MAG: TIGR02678 family protein, partial [Actinomycetota bacterium]|nr:TIGR02678 family protein [Actinomycetota bacterium]